MNDDGALRYLVTVDTSELAGSSGYVNFQFNPADLAAPAAAAWLLLSSMAALTGAARSRRRAVAA